MLRDCIEQQKSVLSVWQDGQIVFQMLYFSLLSFTYLLFDLLRIIPNLSEFSQSKRPSHDQKLQKINIQI